MTTIKDNLSDLQGEGAEKAFRHLYRSYPKVRSAIRRMGGSSGEAEDVFQEALMVLYRKAMEPGFTLRSTPEAYLLSTCRYLWLKTRKEGNSLTPLEDEDLISELSATSDEESQRREALKALRKLGQRCQDLLISFYVFRASMKELSTRFGYSSENVAKNQKYKCLEYARNLYRSTL